MKPQTYNVWSEEETLYLREHLEEETHAQIAAALSRPVQSVNNKIRALQLHVPRDPNSLTKCEVCKSKILGQGKRFCTLDCYYEYKNTIWRRNEIIWHKDKDGYLRGSGGLSCPISDTRGRITQHWYNFAVAHDWANWIVEAHKMGASIHHKNGVRDDNRPENLELRMPGKHPRGWILEDIIEFLEAQGYKVLSPGEEC